MMKLQLFFWCVLSIALCITNSYAKPNKTSDKWRVLALEGGGDKGSYQMGALKAFIELLDPEEVQYDVVTGVSVGAINSFAFALHEKGEEKACIEWMYNLWSNLNQKDIYRSWPLGMLQGLFYEEGLYNNAVEGSFLAKVAQEFTDKKLKRHWIINTCNFDTGMVERFNETSDWNKMPIEVVSSTSMPLMFTHGHLDNKTYVDGGSIWNLEVSKGLDRCVEDGYELKDVVLDVILCGARQISTLNDTSDLKTFDNYARYSHIKTFYGIMSDIDEIIKGYPDVNYRYGVAPTVNLPTGKIPLGFKHDEMMEMIEIGYNDATNVIHNKTANFFTNISESVKKMNDIYDPEKIAAYKNYKVSE